MQTLPQHLGREGGYVGCGVSVDAVVTMIDAQGLDGNKIQIVVILLASLIFSFGFTCSSCCFVSLFIWLCLLLSSWFGFVTLVLLFCCCEFCCLNNA